MINIENEIMWKSIEICQSAVSHGHLGRSPLTTDRCISLTLFATKGLNFRLQPLQPRIQYNTSTLSDQNNHSCLGTFRTFPMASAIWSPTTAAINSRQGMLTALRGATLDFEATRSQVADPSSYRCLEYVATPYAC